MVVQQGHALLRRQPGPGLGDALRLHHLGLGQRPVGVDDPTRAGGGLGQHRRVGRGEVRIGVEGTYPPYTYHDASGKLAGFEYDIAETLADPATLLVR